MMKERIEEISKKHNFERSRLPAFTDEEIEDMKHTADFFAINYYGAYMVKSSPESDYIGEWPTIYQDIGVEIEGNTNWPTTDDERIHVCYII